ncbi:MAG: PQQ-like beta-propeller repeat protein [Thermoplasmatales archaeon]|nr:PQQ-like beta-propeller repeat protein [Thermoplasmatales archaeon]
MNNYKVLAVFLLLMLVNINAYNIAESSQNVQDSSPDINHYEKGSRYNIQGWIYVHIEGAPYERGYQHGYLLADEIVDMINRWSIYASEDVKVMNLFKVKNPVKFWEMSKSKTMRAFSKQYPVEYKEEIRGIADGAKARGVKVHGHDIEYEDIMTLNEFQDCWWYYTYFFKQFHPVRSVFYGIKNIFSSLKSTENEGFCSTFMATGDATSDGSIVAAHSIAPIPYFMERCNIILDIAPDEGNRFVMTSPPGYIWSNENYYQNEKGIIITETTLPQGPWKRGGVPIAVRLRDAIQYSDSIDDVLNTLLEGNNGLYVCEFLIGDTKTGEIASIELALFNTPVKRTFNGFYWSCNIPHDPKVQKELKGFASDSPFAPKFVLKSFDSKIAEKFQEVKQDYYGKIDADVAKEIMAIYPICRTRVDCKITNTEMMGDLGLHAHMGNPNGSQWNPSEEKKKLYAGITELPASGWVEIYPLNYRPYNIQDERIKTYSGESENYKLITEYEKDDFEIGSFERSSIEEENDVILELKEDGILTSPYQIDDETLYFGSWDGKIYSINEKNGEIKWTFQTGWSIVSKPYVSDKTVYIGSLDNNFYAVDSENGDLKWIFRCKSAIQSSPVVYGDYVFFGCDDGRFYALNKETGDYVWSFTPGYYIKDDALNYLATPIQSDPYVEDGIVYFSANGKVYGLDTQTSESSNDKLKEDPIDFMSIGLYLLLILGIAILIWFYSKTRR